MSSSYVRAKFRSWANEVAVLARVPFYDTVNVNVSQQDSLWWTCEFDAISHQGVFNQKSFIELGFITIIVNAAPGTGDADAIAAIEAIVPRLNAKIDPSQRLTLEIFEPVIEDSAGSADKNYRVSVSINYRYCL